MAMPLVAVTAQAQVFEPFSQRYGTVTRGDLVMLANSSMTCASPVNGSCNAVKNDALSMVNSKLPADAADATIYNSSSSNLTSAQLPPGAQVQKAILYWGGLVPNVLNAPSPNPASAGVRFGTPGGGYQSRSADACRLSPSVTTFAPGAQFLYRCHVDVTAAVQAGGTGSYRVANVPSQSGTVNRFGGWSLVLVIANPTRPLRSFSINDGLALVATTGASPVNQVSVNVSGFRTPSSGAVTAQLGWVAYDGDLGAADGFTFQGQGSSQVNVSDACNPVGDVFNSTICALGSPVTTRSIVNGNGSNTQGFDADIVQLANAGNTALGNGVTSATLTARTSSEGYAITVLTTAIDVYQPTIDGSAAKTQSNLTHPDLSAGRAMPGDEIRYQIVLNNVGQDNAENVVVRDAIPANTYFVPGSLEVLTGPNAGPKSDAAGDDQSELVAGNVVFRVGQGADAITGGTLRCITCVGTQATGTAVAFRVRVRTDAAPGTLIRNLAQATFTGASSGETFSEPTDEVVMTVLAPPKLRVVKTIASRAAVADQFTVAIDNGGPSATSGGTATSIATTVFNATAGTLYTLSESGAGTPAANLANYTTTYDCLNATPDGTTIPAGVGTSVQITPADNDDITCTFTNIARVANLRISKSNSATSVVKGLATSYALVVDNLGPMAADGAVLRDPVAAGLSCTTATCTASGGATCPVATGAALLGLLQSANGVAIPALAANSSATFLLTCNVD
ncbi:MAG: DUF11 domain-containing protein [Lysobacteraceae bacterium]|nr:MAG: DUF11 domain-containing protein [Xanthomonadaceae bacterium]